MFVFNLIWDICRYFDGCNECSGCQDVNGPICTDLACTTKSEAYCKSCVDGYELINGYCVESCGGFDNCAVYSDGCNTC